MEVSAVSLQDAPPSVAPVRPLPGEQPAKGFSWEDYEGVQVDEDASSEEEGGWGVVRSRRSQFILSMVFESWSELTTLIRRNQQDCVGGRRNGSHHHHVGHVAVAAADEKAASERAAAGGVEGSETREGGAAAGGFVVAQARTRARPCGRATCCSKAYRISLRFARLTLGKGNLRDEKDAGPAAKLQYPFLVMCKLSPIASACSLTCMSFFP